MNLGLFVDAASNISQKHLFVGDSNKFHFFEAFKYNSVTVVNQTTAISFL